MAAAGRVRAACAGVAPECALVTVAGRLGPEAVGEALGLPAVARWKPDRSIGAAVERGHGPHLSRRVKHLAVAVLDAVGLA